MPAPGDAVFFRSPAFFGRWQSGERRPSCGSLTEDAEFIVRIGAIVLMSRMNTDIERRGDIFADLREPGRLHCRPERVNLQPKGVDG